MSKLRAADKWQWDVHGRCPTSTGIGWLPHTEPRTDGGQLAGVKPSVAMTVKLPRELYVRLKTEAAARGTNGQRLMLEAVRNYLSNARYSGRKSSVSI